MTTLASAAGHLAGSALGWAIFGAAVGSLLRSPAIALAAGFAYALPIENVLAASWSSASDWLPGQLLANIAKAGSDHTTIARPLLLTVTYATLALAAAAVAIGRSEI